MKLSKNKIKVTKIKRDKTQGYPQLHSEFEASLEYIKPCQVINLGVDLFQGPHAVDRTRSCSAASGMQASHQLPQAAAILLTWQEPVPLSRRIPAGQASGLGPRQTRTRDFSSPGPKEVSTAACTIPTTHPRPLGSQRKLLTCPLEE